jgi:hypothetical protein
MNAAMVLSELERHERKVYSQNGEDGVLEAIFAAIGTTNRYFVEFGCGDTMECNCRRLLEQGWRGLFMDRAGTPPLVQREHVSAENINGLLAKNEVPQVFDLLSIDIDGNDYWVWQAITWRPRVVVIEYNAHVAGDRTAIAYDPAFEWTGTDYFGASLRALAELAEEKGYRLVYCERCGVDAFFIAADALPPGFAPAAVETLYRPPNYGNQGRRHPPDPTRAMIDPAGARSLDAVLCSKPDKTRAIQRAMLLVCIMLL